MITLKFLAKIRRINIFPKYIFGKSQFSAYFGLTVKAFLTCKKVVFVNDGLRYSKNGQLVSKILNGESGVNAQFCSVNLSNLIFMDTKIEIREMLKIQIVYVRHIGAFNQIEKAYGKLMRWAELRKLHLLPHAKTVTLYRNDRPANVEKKHFLFSFLLARF